MFFTDTPFLDHTGYVGEMPLCSVLLMNNKLYPWLVLVPKRDGVTEITDLSPEDRARFMEEVAVASGVMQEIYWPDKINIASLGNQVPQLHMDIIARFKTDDIWPEPVWGADIEPYTSEGLDVAMAALRQHFARLEAFRTIANLH